MKTLNPDMPVDLQLVTLFLCLYLIYLVYMLPFRMIFFQNFIACSAFFPRKFSIFLSFGTLVRDLFVIFNENLSQ